MAKEGVYRVHLSLHGGTNSSQCRRWWCLKRHHWASVCECGWTGVYRRRWQADRALKTFHLEDDHGGDDD